MYQNLKSLRTSLGMTQEEFGKTVGVAKTTYSNYEQGAREPKSDFWISVANKYGVTIDYLMGRCNEPSGLYSKSKSAPDTPGTDRRLNFIIDCYNGMNADGQNRLVEQAEMLKTSGKYDKHSNIQTELNA